MFNTPVDVIQDFYRHVYLERGETLTNGTLNTLWSITNALFPLGGVFGGLSSGFFADNFGRKNGLILVNILVIITSCLNIVSKYVNSIETLMAGRFITGVFLNKF